MFSNVDPFLRKQIVSKPFIVRTNVKLDVAITQLWKDVFKYIINNQSIRTIFVHNLSEAGLHVYKYLMLNFSKTAVSCIIDPDNNFITIKLRHHSRTITWLDSNRIFPVNIIDFCKVFEIKCPIVKPMTLDKLYFTSKNWVFQADSVAEGLALYQALIKAQTQYLNNYSVDITKVVSTSNLSLQIYRRHFMPVNIPILKGSQDIFIRNSYYGGATDYYKAI